MRWYIFIYGKLMCDNRRIALTQEHGTEAEALIEAEQIVAKEFTENDKRWQIRPFPKCNWCGVEIELDGWYLCPECRHKEIEFANLVNAEMKNIYNAIYAVGRTLVTSKGWYYVYERQPLQLRRIDRAIHKLQSFKKIIERFEVSRKECKKCQNPPEWVCVKCGSPFCSDHIVAPENLLCEQCKKFRERAQFPRHLHGPIPCGGAHDE